MPANAKSFPAYPRKPHKSGHARIKLDGRNHWFGPHGSAESIEKYEALKLEWVARQDGTGAKLTVDELCLLYKQHAESYYVKPDGTPTNDAATIRGALRFVIDLFGTTRVREFGPKRRSQAPVESPASCPSYSRDRPPRRSGNNAAVRAADVRSE
jgi:hypothetical protein